MNESSFFSQVQGYPTTRGKNAYRTGNEYIHVKTTSNFPRKDDRSLLAAEEHARTRDAQFNVILLIDFQAL